MDAGSLECQRIYAAGYLARIRRHPEQAGADLVEAHRFATLARYPNGVQRIRGVRARLDPRCDDLDYVRELDDLLRVCRYQASALSLTSSHLKGG